MLPTQYKKEKQIICLGYILASVRRVTRFF